MNCLKFILCVLFLVFGTVRGWASAAATLTNHNLVYFQIDALPTAIPTNVIMLTGNLTNWQKLLTNVICNPCLIINPTDTYVPYRIDASTFGDSWWYYLVNGIGIDTNIFFGPGTSNVLYRTTTNLRYANTAATLPIAFEIQDAGLHNNAITVTHGYATLQTTEPQIGFTAAGTTFYLDKPTKSVFPNGILGIGRAIFPWTNNFFSKTTILGTNDGVGNYAWTQLWQENTNSPFVINQITAGTAGYARGFEFWTNGGIALKIAPDSLYTGTGANFLSDDGTFKAGSGLGVTINPSDTYVPYRINGTTFGDSWWYYLTTGMGIDTNIYFGPGTTNILTRTNGTDLIYYAPAYLSQPAGIEIKRGTANPVFFGATSAGGAMVSSPANRAILDVGAVSAFWDGTSFQPADGAKNLGNTSGQGWHTVYATNSYVLAPYDDHDTNYVRTIQTMTGPFTTFNLQSITNGVNGPVSGFEFRTNGVKIFRIPEAIWVDSMVPQTAVRVGATAPTTAAFNGGPATTLMFQNNRDDTVEFSVQLNHNYKQGTDISPHVHWCETAATGAGTNVVWELTYTWQNVNGVFGAYNTLYTTNYVTTTNWFHQLSEFPDIAGSGKTVSSILVCQLRRLANSATADNYDQNVAFLGCDIHYQVDSPGSDSELSKSF